MRSHFSVLFNKRTRYVVLPLTLSSILLAAAALGLLNLAKAKVMPSTVAAAQGISPASSCANPPPPALCVAPSHPTSLTQAKAAYPLPFLLPKRLPTGYHLKTIDYYNGSPQAPSFELLVLHYNGPGGDDLVISQGVPLPIDGSSSARVPADHQGSVSVQGKQAFWSEGLLAPVGSQGAQGHPSASWQPGPVRLTWKTDTGNDLAGYQLQSNALALSELTSIAQSVQQYP